MSTVQQELLRIKQAKAGCKASIEEKGVTVGDGLLDTYPAKIDSITTGSAFYKCAEIVKGTGGGATLTITSDKEGVSGTYNITDATATGVSRIWNQVDGVWSLKINEDRWKFYKGSEIGPYANYDNMSVADPWDVTAWEDPVLLEAVVTIVPSAGGHPTWNGYLMEYDENGIWLPGTTLSTGLTFDTIEPFVGGVFDNPVTMQSVNYFTSTASTDGLIFYADLQDSVGTSQTGQAIVNNNMSWTYDRTLQRPVASFNGSTSWIKFTPNSTYPSKNVTISCWAMTTSTDRMFIGYGTDNPYSVAILRTATDGYLGVDRGSGAIASTKKVNDGCWHHLAATISDTTLLLYCDGIQVYSGSHTFSLATSGGSIGAWLSGSSGLSGRMCKARIYNRVLPPAEIKVLASELQTSDSELLDDNTLFLLDASQGIQDCSGHATATPTLYTKDTNGSIKITDSFISLSMACLRWEGVTGISLTGDFTVEAYMESLDQGQLYPSVITNSTSWESGTFSLRYGLPSAPYGGIFWNPGDPLLRPTDSTVPSGFTHIAAVRKSGTVHYLKNKVSLGSVADTRTLSFPTIAIGHGLWDGMDGYANMKVSYIRISNIARYI